MQLQQDYRKRIKKRKNCKFIIFMRHQKIIFAHKKKNYFVIFAADITKKKTDRGLIVKKIA